MYATQQNFIDTFGEIQMIQLTNLDNASATAINVAQLEANQIKAYALINGMIAGCPDVAALMPFAEAPSLLIGYELDITRYYLERNIAREDVRQRYEDAISQLKLIGKCQLSLGLVGSPAKPLETGGNVSWESNCSLSESSFLSGY